MTDIAATLKERGSRYGAFIDHAACTQALKDILRLYSAAKTLAPDQQEALDMICHKMGRIVCGDPDYADSWVDIAGYAKLVADRLEGEIARIALTPMPDHAPHAAVRERVPLSF